MTSRLTQQRGTPAQTIMVQGTTSDAGKSFLVTALCRLFHQQGISVAPFKPQNMALNSAVTRDGGEIGRAQAVQAMAAGLAPEIDMNPLLLKPNSDTGAQVIVHGHALENMEAAAYHDYKKLARKAVLESYHRLAGKHQLIIVEGAGSPAEINLRENDIANMGFAEAVDCPVILIADIDRGGVFAHLIGTLQLLSASERQRVKGFVINRFRGDKALLQGGLDWLTAETGIPVLGVLPYLESLQLEAEDALPRRQFESGTEQSRLFRVVIPAFPRISNHTDFDVLHARPDVEVVFAGPGKPLPAADLIILPGSKNVRQDLAWLREQGWEAEILRQLRYGVKLMGICGGFQMLGKTIDDPYGIEAPPGASAGLGLLDMHTRLEPRKQLRNVRGQLLLMGSATAMEGYEIHAGVTSGKALDRPLCHLQQHLDGAQSADNQVIGTYVHGIMDQAADTLLHWAGLENPQALPTQAQQREVTFNRIAACVEQHMHWEALLTLG